MGYWIRSESGAGRWYTPPPQPQQARPEEPQRQGYWYGAQPGGPAEREQAQRYAQQLSQVDATRSRPMAASRELLRTERLAPQVGTDNYSHALALAARGQQQNAYDQWRALQQNQVASAAQAQQQQGVQRAQQQAMALAASQRGNAMAARRAGLEAQSQIGLQGHAQLEQLQAQEAARNAQMGAQGMAGAAAGMREQDYLRTAQGQEAAIANQDAIMRSRQLDDAMRAAGLSGMGSLTAQGQQQAAALMDQYNRGIISREQLIAEMYATGRRNQAELDALNKWAKQQKQDSAWDIAGSVFKGIAMMGLGSDERAKERVKDARGDVARLLATIKPRSYNYKTEALGAGRQYGLMAQDLERSPMGKAMVSEVAGLKVVDTRKAAVAALTAAAHLAERLERMEGKGRERNR